MKLICHFALFLLLLEISSCISYNCCVNHYCISANRISPSVYKAIEKYVIADTLNNAFVLFSSNFFDYDRSTLNKKAYDFFLIGPNYVGLMDSLGWKHKFRYPSVYAYEYDSIVKGRVAPRRYPILHCHIKRKIVFIQSSLDLFVSNAQSTSIFKHYEINVADGRSQFMRESMGIIKFPNGNIKTFIVGDSILTEDRLSKEFRD